MTPLLKVLIIGPSLLIAIVLHEMAHAWVAEKLGDDTARKKGRITLNPLRHIDPFMTVALPLLLIFSGSPIVFGAAKPVPVNPANFKDPRRGMLLVAIAGPLMNIALACVTALIYFACFYTGLFHILPEGISVLLVNALSYGVLINVVLAAFNMIPVPPLDGGRVAVGLLPLKAAHAYARLERFGLLIVVFLLLTGIIDSYLQPIVEVTFKLFQ